MTSLLSHSVTVQDALQSYARKCCFHFWKLDCAGQEMTERAAKLSVQVDSVSRVVVILLPNNVGRDVGCVGLEINSGLSRSIRALFTLHRGHAGLRKETINLHFPFFSLSFPPPFFTP
ncbi:hypothetical protein PNOK_0167100 [Pyrrhoderma noxium]|uniref:Uncharacterized protein n=1 Tax=Pyrrhoderma noxium TaxID=2282107 RepID=A0A286UQB5_9AGAM|nr:hypothetical protein PNOK_0167100 [Pyrrhoderma noxium]